MKYLFLVLSIFLFTSIKANNYYFSTSQGDDLRTVLQAQQPATPWKTISKLNGFINLSPGDSIFFKRGDIFFGTIVAVSGLPNKEVVYSAFGIGPNPIISGLATLNSWTNNGNGIYWAHLAVPTLNVVSLDGLL